MMKYRAFAAVVITGLLLLLSRAFSANGQGVQDQNTQSVEGDCLTPGRSRLAHLHAVALNEEKRTVLFRESREGRRELEGILLRQLMDPEAPKEVIFSAAFLLGEYRMEEGTPLRLAKLIALKNDYAWEGKDVEKYTLLGGFHIATALRKIGNPSVRYMIQNLETGDDDLVRRLSAGVIFSVQDRDLEVCRLIIERAIQKQSDVKKKQRLQSALQYFASPPEQTASEKNIRTQPAQTVTPASDEMMRKRASELHTTALQKRSKQITELITICQNSTDNQWQGSKDLAMETLGLMRAREAVDVLSANLLFLPGGPRFWSQMETQSFYSAAVALVRIGEPSINAMLQKIRRSPSQEERQVAAWVIMHVEGQEQAIYRLQRLVETSTAVGETKTRLNEAVTYLTNFRPTDHPPGRSDKLPPEMVPDR